jgi:hypothetical protein
LDGNALQLLDKAASLSRTAILQERLTGLLQEVRVNRNLVQSFVSDLQAFVEDPADKPFPFLRFRNTASSNYLNTPFPIPNLSIDVVDQYWQIIRMLNDLANSIDGPLSVGDFRKGRAQGVVVLAPQSITHGATIETAVTSLLSELNGAFHL